MRFFNAFVRGTVVGAVPDADVESLARLLVEQPCEVLLTAQGAWRNHGNPANGRPATLDTPGGRSPRANGRTQSVPGASRATAALARRNVRSLLTRNGSASQVAAALKTAMAAAPRDAEDALEDAGLVLNLRYSLFATPDAAIRIENNELIIADDKAPSIRIPRTELREQGAACFGPDALARLVSLEVAAVRFSESAILPLALQREPGAVMEPDTAHERLHKGEWRANRIPHFAKEYCITCARCFIHCPDNAIMHAMFDKTAKDSTGILGIDYDRCTACGLCASVCPTDRNGYKSIVMVESGTNGTAEVHHVA